MATRALPPAPTRVLALPRDRRGYPVPWFVAWIDSGSGREPDFRVIAPGKIDQAITRQLCWICGTRITGNYTFVIGPMCAVNRISAEPPSHRDCAIFAARACPFLARPGMRRRESNIPDEARNPAGIMIRRNPGVALVWVTKSYRLVADGRGGTLIEVGKPAATLWYAEGRPATRAEVMASIESGLPALREVATQSGEPADLALLDAQLDAALTLVPAEPLEVST